MGLGAGTGIWKISNIHWNWCAGEYQVYRNPEPRSFTCHWFRCTIHQTDLRLPWFRWNTEIGLDMANTNFLTLSSYAAANGTAVKKQFQKLPPLLVPQDTIEGWTKNWVKPFQTNRLCPGVKHVLIFPLCQGLKKRPGSLVAFLFDSAEKYFSNWLNQSWVGGLPKHRKCMRSR